MHKIVEVFSLWSLRRRASVVVIVDGGPHLAPMARRLHLWGTNLSHWLHGRICGYMWRWLVRSRSELR